MFCMSMIVFAQSSMLATLSHNGEISTFYGAMALRDAHIAADHGDIITLSSGSFTATDITKAVTIRGAGMFVDTLANTLPTIITGNFNINIPDTVKQRLTMEGLYHNHNIAVRGILKNALFLKNRFHVFTRYDSDTRLKNVTFIHCKVIESLGNSKESSISCINCYITDAYSESYTTTSNFEFSNCLIVQEDCFMNNITSSNYSNCIIYYKGQYTGSYDEIDSYCTAFNCVGKNLAGEDIFKNLPNTTNKKIEELNSLFRTYTGSYNDNETFELTDSAKTQYLGADGTEVGIYGGNLPFDPIPTNPQIKKCNVASKSTADGKLSVDIEVSVAN